MGLQLGYPEVSPGAAANLLTQLAFTLRVKKKKKAGVSEFMDYFLTPVQGNGGPRNSCILGSI